MCERKFGWAVLAGISIGLVQGRVHRGIVSSNWSFAHSNSYIGQKAGFVRMDLAMVHVRSDNYLFADQQNAHSLLIS